MASNYNWRSTIYDPLNSAHNRQNAHTIMSCYLQMLLGSDVQIDASQPCASPSITNSYDSGICAIYSCMTGLTSSIENKNPTASINANKYRRQWISELAQSAIMLDIPGIYIVQYGMKYRTFF